MESRVVAQSKMADLLDEARQLVAIFTTIFTTIDKRAKGNQ